MTEEHVTFRRQISDGQYGSETVEVTLMVENRIALSEVQQALRDARTLVQQELLRSPSLVVRRAMERELAPVLKEAVADYVEENGSPF
jgi:hypothetical protein